MINLGSKTKKDFVITIEVVPPEGSDAGPLLESLKQISTLPFYGFSVATNPVAKPRMCAMVFSRLIQDEVGKPSIFHCTVRDHNRLSLKSMLWGAKALGINTVLVASGDRVSPKNRNRITSVGDADIYELIGMARKCGLQTGAVLDFRPEADGLAREIKRLAKKIAAGAEFIVTQPLYDDTGAQKIYKALRDKNIGIPVFMGILPLRTFRHAEFLHSRVPGIGVSSEIRKRMYHAQDPTTEGIVNAKEMITIAKELFDGACIMPPFDHYEVLPEILGV